VKKIKTVILAGGFGTRLSELTDVIPKPMVEIGGKPMLWHIMKIYSYYGFNDFIIALGYKGYIIKEYFTNYFLHNSDLTIDVTNNKVDFHKSHVDPWSVTLVDTGQKSMTGGRVKRIEKYTEGERFMLTYGDGLSNVNLNKLIEFHDKQKKYATLTAVQPAGRFGALVLDNMSNVSEFKEKPKGDKNWINGGFFVLENEIFDYIEGDYTYCEQDPLEKLSNDNQLAAFKHKGFWKPMDMLKDKISLESMWEHKNAQWKVWDD